MTTAADYSENIPNTLPARGTGGCGGPSSPGAQFLNWCGFMGRTPPTQDVYLRTAVDVGREGWANFGDVAMRDYRWGIFLAERDPDRRIGFGQHMGEPAWQQVPGEYRSELRD